MRQTKFLDMTLAKLYVFLALLLLLSAVPVVTSEYVGKRPVPVTAYLLVALNADPQYESYNVFHQAVKHALMITGVLSIIYVVSCAMVAGYSAIKKTGGKHE